jgi:asparagine synthase (glutamine-hydrolysing)
MSGIGGILHTAKRTGDPTSSNNMLKVLGYRSKSRNSKYQEEMIELVSASYPIIASHTTYQPIFSINGRYVLVGSGQIYNHAELRKLLPPYVQSAMSVGDLSVSLEIFSCFGPSYLEKLRGPFALAIWDKLQKELWIVRDRLGEKSLYYYNNSSCLIFASEMRAISAAVNNHISLSIDSLLSFLTIGRTFDQSTLYENVFLVPPGCVLNIQFPCNKMNFSSLKKFNFTNQASNCPRAIDNLISQAIDRILIADQPISLAFSGGLDSTVILEHARKKVDFAAVITLFNTLNFKNDKNLPRARIAARALGVNLVEVPVTLPCPSNLVSILQEKLDGPGAEPIVMHNNALHEIAQEFSPVLLVGHGADEVFGGYKRYQKIMQWMKYSSESNSKTFSDLLDYAPKLDWERLMRLLETNTLSQFILLDAFSYQPSASSIPTSFVQVGELQRNDLILFAQCLDLFEFHEYDNFRLPDQNSHANGIEVRSPYFDTDLITAIFSLKLEDRIIDNNLKHFLRKRVTYLVNSINRRKVGFDDFFDYRNWVLHYKDDLREAIWYSPLKHLKMIRPKIISSLCFSDAMLSRNWRFVWRAFTLATWLERNVTIQSNKIN